MSGVFDKKDDKGQFRARLISTDASDTANQQSDALQVVTDAPAAPDQQDSALGVVGTRPIYRTNRTTRSGWRQALRVMRTGMTMCRPWRLNQTSFITGTKPDSVWVRANDGFGWSNWSPFTIGPG